MVPPENSSFHSLSEKGNDIFESWNYKMKEIMELKYNEDEFYTLESSFWRLPSIWLSGFFLTESLSKKAQNIKEEKLKSHI